MNTLSWMIYVADTVPSIGTWLSVVGAASSVAGMGLTIGGTVPWTRYSWDRDETAWADKMAVKDKLAKGGPKLVVAGLCMMLAGGLIPSSRTIYMIAASQAGEQIVTSPDAVEMMGDLKAIIKKRLKDDLGAK